MFKLELEQENIAVGTHSFLINRVKNLDALVDQVSDDKFNKDERLPYWAELWPSARALSRFILDNADIFKSREVLELGCGLGLTTLALAKTGPALLLATDYEQDALDHAAKNFELNQKPSPDFAALDWRIPNLRQTFDVIVASDVAYEERFFQPLISLFKEYLKPGGVVILAEPNRRIARGFFGKLALSGFHYEQTDMFVHQDPADIKVSIYQIKTKQ